MVTPSMRRLILRNFQSAGDIVMLTAAVRDLHRSYPGEFLTDVQTPFPQLWANNPYITPLRDDDDGVQVIECHYPLIHQSNSTPCHFLHGFPAYLNDVLGLRIRVTDFKGDIYISDEEKAWFTGIQDGIRLGGSVLAAGVWRQAATSRSNGGTTPDTRRSSTHFDGRIQFVQVGEASHHHPPLDGVIDLRGRTDLRRLVLLMYHAQGVDQPGQPAHASGRGRGDAAGGAAQPAVRGHRRRARAAAFHGISAPPVHSHRWRAALLRQWRLLEIANGAAWRRRRKRSAARTSA